MPEFLENEQDDYIDRIRETYKAENELPRQVTNPDWTELRKICQDYMDEVSSGGYVDEDLPHYIYETALQTLFGKDVFRYINARRV